MDGRGGPSIVTQRPATRPMFPQMRSPNFASGTRRVGLGRKDEMPLRSGLAALTIQDDESVDLGATSPPALSRGSSFDVSLNDTFKAGGGTPLDSTIRLRPEGMEVKGAQFSDISLADLDKGKMLGKGASGRVFLVTHRRTKEQYALKQLTALADKAARHQALNELRIATNHCGKAEDGKTEHLVRLVDAFFHEGNISMLMELCDGGSLDDQLRLSREQGQAATMPLAPLAYQICTGVRYMHETMKQVHRDLKPANILLTSEGVVKLTDFGVSKQLNSTDAFAMTQVGTTSYMSPERLKGNDYTYPSDVWSVGVIVLEMLRGAHPFNGTSFMAICKAICEEPLPAPPDGTAPEPVAFVDECLQREPSARKSAGALLDGEWLKPLRHRDVRQAVFKWLMGSAASAAMTSAAANAEMKRRAREMARRAIASSSDAPLDGDDDLFTPQGFVTPTFTVTPQLVQASCAAASEGYAEDGTADGMKQTFVAARPDGGDSHGARRVNWQE